MRVSPWISRVEDEVGFTLVELLVVAAVVAILLALAIPNLVKARISANEANARKMLQTLRDAEHEYFVQDADDDGVLDYTNLIGDLNTPGSLRCPAANCTVDDALIDSTFEGAIASGGGTADCPNPKGGYCVQFDSQNVQPSSNGIYDDYGWQASPAVMGRTGRKDYSVYADGVIRCITGNASNGAPGNFFSDRNNSTWCD